MSLQCIMCFVLYTYVDVEATLLALLQPHVEFDPQENQYTKHYQNNDGNEGEEDSKYGGVRLLGWWPPRNGSWVTRWEGGCWPNGASVNRLQACATESLATGSQATSSILTRRVARSARCIGSWRVCREREGVKEEGGVGEGEGGVRGRM